MKNDTDINRVFLFLDYLKNSTVDQVKSLIENQVFFLFSSYDPKNIISYLKEKHVDMFFLEDDIIDVARAFVDKTISDCDKLGCGILNYKDAEFPLFLKNAHNTPLVLFKRGELKKNNRYLGVVGTRENTPMGQKIAERVVDWFTYRDWSIVSGLAKGIDTIAHTKAVSLEAGHTVAVLAHGLDTVYPGENRELAHKIIDTGGCLLSEYPIGTKIEKKNFIDRDKIQAGISAGVVMVQSGKTGGSLHASRHILRQERALIVPYLQNFDDKNKFEANVILSQPGPSSKISMLFKKGDSKEKELLENIFALTCKEGYCKINGILEKHLKVATQIEAEKNQKTLF